MREFAISVSLDVAEPVLDRLIPLAPYGLLVDGSDDEVIFRLRAPTGELPSVQVLAQRVGGDLRGIQEREVPDDWPARRLLDYRPQIVSGICVRPDWAPQSDASIEVVIQESEAFGSGLHPTTRDCLKLLGAVEFRGSFADLGCGSGVLSIAAVKLGFRPVIAVDVQPESVSATRRNAELSGVDLEVTQLDLLTQPAPSGDLVCINAPAAVHAAVIMSLARPPELVIASGLPAHEFPAVSCEYARVGMTSGFIHQEASWITCVFAP